MNYYQIFEINQSSSHDEIKKAYRRLANRYHPDKHNGDLYYESKFKQINYIYKVLSDPQRRINYNISLEKKEKYNLHQKSPRQSYDNNDVKQKEGSSSFLVRIIKSNLFRYCAIYFIFYLIYLIGGLLLNLDFNHIYDPNKRMEYNNVENSQNTGDINFYKLDTIKSTSNQSSEKEKKDHININNKGDIKF
jgi:curved DNA-binding protein CbpA